MGRYTVSIGKDLTDVSTDLDAFLWRVGNSLTTDTAQRSRVLESEPIRLSEPQMSTLLASRCTEQPYVGHSSCKVPKFFSREWKQIET